MTSSRSATFAARVVTVSTVTIGTVAVVAAMAVGSSRLVAQGALAQLGLTEASASTFVIDEIRSPANGRRAPIVLAGTRGFLGLPPAARGPAATALFAWAKAYVSSPAFRAGYDSYRAGLLPAAVPEAATVDDTLQREAEERRTALEEMRKNLAASGLPRDEQEQILAAWKAAEEQVASPEFTEAVRRATEAERAEASASQANLVAEVEERAPADPQRLFARRLREFLDATADVNFAARTISLTGGPDGIEFRDKPDRQRHWLWQAAAIVGPEATAAARAAAEAWLGEIDR